MKNILIAAIAAIASSVALAAPITGSIAFSGTFSDNVDDVTGTGSLDFDNVTQYAVARDGDFSTALTGDFLVGDVQFGPVTVTAGVVDLPIDTLWSIIGASFVMDTVTTYSNDSGGVVLNGAGVLSLTGYDDTRGIFSMDTADQAFTFDADTRAVPAPGALALIAIGLVGLALERRRR